MSVSRIKVWISGEILTASALNSEVSNILDNGEDLGWPATKTKDMDGQELILDSDGDTSITGDIDDRIDFRLSGSDLFRLDGTVATPVNGLDWIASAAGNAVQVKAVGSDSNISINLVPKGNGRVQEDGVNIGNRASRLAGSTLFKAQTARMMAADNLDQMTLIGQVYS